MIFILLILLGEATLQNKSIEPGDSTSLSKDSIIKIHIPKGLSAGGKAGDSSATSGLRKQMTNYKGDTLYYLWQDKIIWLIGNAEVETPDVKAKADSIKFYSSKNLVDAYGKPILWVGDQEIKGEKMKYDLNTGEGIIKNGRTKISKGWFDGKIIRKVGNNVLNINDGKFTTCDLVPPHYYFWGRDLKVYVDDMVYARPLVMFVGDIPVFAAPFWWFPIKKGRKSGLMNPQIGNSSANGKYVENLAYYWVTNAWSDMTFTLNYYELRGPQALYESRWANPYFGTGSLNGSYINDISTSSKQWSLDFSHSQRFTAQRLSVIAEGHFLSNIGYTENFNQDVIVNLDKEFRSYLSATKSWDWGSTSFLVEELKNFATNDVTEQLPQINYSINSKRILGGYFGYSGSFANLMDSTNAPYIQQLNNSASYSIPFRLFRYLSIAPSTQQTLANDWPKPVAKPYIATYSIGASTKIYSKTVFKPEFRQVITPSIAFSLQDTTKACSFGVGNDFYLMLGKRQFQLATLNLGSSWSFVEHRINPVGITLTSNPIPLISLQAYGTYNYYSDSAKFKFERLSTTHNFSRGTFGLSLTYNLVPGENQSLWGTLNMKLTQNWKLSLSRRYDFTAKQMVGEDFSLYRDLDCWEGVFSFDKYGNAWKYDIQLKLKALPEIKVDKGLFGFL